MPIRLRLLPLMVVLAAACGRNGDVVTLPEIPDAAYAKGVSAPFCGVIGETLVVAGGANFPDKSLLEGGAKRVYADIWALSGEGWSQAGILPDSTAYGATFAVDGALILAGGHVNGVSTDKVYELTLQDGASVLRPLPPLPEPMEQCGWTCEGNKLYLVGGLGTTGVYACTIGEYEWSRLADLPEPLVQPLAYASGGNLYVWGGFNPETLEVSDKGLVIPVEEPESPWREAPAIPDGGTFVGATGATLPDGRLVVVGGVNRAIFARALHNTLEDRIPYLSKEPAEYQFRQTVYAFDPASESWTLLGSDPACALAGPGVAVRADGGLFVAGGELKPGVRSPKIFSLRLPTATPSSKPALLPLPKQVVYMGGSIRTGAPETLTFVEAIPEAVLNENEAYRLTIDKTGIHIEAVTERGAWNARQTLRQLAQRGRIPCCRIVDWPSFRVRGWMMDVGRTYISVEELKREVDIFSQFKVNVFHLHLTENEAWRLESTRYPQLNAPESMLRQPGMFYSQVEMRELDAYCRERGVTLIPELDMPGHSGAFERVMGFGMQTPEGKAVLKELLDEVFDTFSGPYVHIGTDEVAFTDFSLIKEMVAYIRAHGRKALSWNPGWPYRAGEIDGLQLWSDRGQAKEGIPAVDCRLHYVNHFDLFGDIIGLHTSTVYGQTEGSDGIAGSILALWNDRYLTCEENILKENNLYACVLALADRAWRGGGYQYFDDFGTVLPDGGPARADFLGFEQRMLAFRETLLKDAPMAYVAQGQARWAISPAYPNGGALEKAFPPEEGQWETDRIVTGSGIYFRHVWGPEEVAGYYPDPRPDLTVYARAKVWSPRRQTVGLLFETQDYSRSERDTMPPQGAWDFRHSRLWLNGTEILPPAWVGNAGRADRQEPFGNANCAGRAPRPVSLNKGWNEILVKLPVGAFSTPEYRLVKWMFTCALTTPDGRAAAEVKYSTDFSTSSK